MDEFFYDAFISYSHRDMKWARWLQRKLERFQLPKEIAQERKDAKNLKIFRDQTDLAGAELAESLNRELKRARWLVVICSPASASSRWVNEEIRSFCALGRKDRIIPFIVSGEPGSDRPELECFAPALLGDETNDLLGVNIQEIGKNKAFLKTASVLLDVRFNRLVDRARQLRRKMALIIGSLSASVALVTGSLLWQNRKITEENRELNFDIYGVAMMFLAQNSDPQPEVLAFLETSAKQGNAEAMMYLADCYHHGWGTDQDDEKAFHWMKRAAEAGNAEAMSGTGNYFLQGIGTEADSAEAYRWYLKSAEAGNAEAMVNVGLCLQGGEGTEQDEKAALSWFRKAAGLGNLVGMSQMAMCYRTGTGTEMNPKMAFYWVRRMAEDGNHPKDDYHIMAMFNMGLMYQHGIGTEVNPEEAYRWYRSAADAGLTDAMRMVGWCLENRFGVTNPALEWYERAAKAGDAEAREAVERLRNQEN